MEKIFYYIYSRKLSLIIIFIILSVPVWGEIGYLSEKRSRVLWRMLNTIIVVIVIGLIAYITLANRTLENRMICLMPFDSFVRAQIQPEIYRSMLMNVFLFFPLGLTLPYALPDKWKHQAVIAILFAMGLSVAIEFWQYYFCLGRAETDDVICNTIGCVIGTIAYQAKSIPRRNSNNN